MATNFVRLNRKSETRTVTVAAGTGTSSYLSLDGYAIGMIHLPSTYDSVALTFTVCPTSDGTYQPYIGSDGNAVSLTVAASKSIAIPEGLFGAPYIKLVGGTNEGGSGSTITVTLRG